MRVLSLAYRHLRFGLHYVYRLIQSEDHAWSARMAQLHVQQLSRR